jgi:hypothetical protein
VELPQAAIFDFDHQKIAPAALRFVVWHIKCNVWRW